jgi:GH15 family glucan-1,4-alpha-glucosidase
MTSAMGRHDARIAVNLAQIERCRYPSGLYSAVPPESSVKVDLYRNVWIRDTIYTLLAFEAMGDLDALRAGVHALLDRVLLRWQYRLDWRIVEGIPNQEIEYLHPRYAPDGSELYSELWGLRQDDAIGLAVWALGRWQERFEIFRNDYVDFHLLQKLIWYLDRTGVPHVPDSGIWEEEGPSKAVHLSSLAAVAAGLTQAARIGVADIPARLRAETQWKIEQLAGRESAHHDTDLALLTLIWPFGEDIPVPRSVQRAIVERVESELVGTRGVVRYRGDGYHVCHGGPPEWTMGFGFLALAWNALGDPARGCDYIDRLHACATESGEYPESWCRDPGHDQNFNSPLCWSHALDIVAYSQLGQLSAARAGGRNLSAAAEEPGGAQQAGLSSR